MSTVPPPRLQRGRVNPSDSMESISQNAFSRRLLHGPSGKLRVDLTNVTPELVWGFDISCDLSQILPDQLGLDVLLRSNLFNGARD